MGGGGGGGEGRGFLSVGVMITFGVAFQCCVNLSKLIICCHSYLANILSLSIIFMRVRVNCFQFNE